MRYHGLIATVAVACVVVCPAYSQGLLDKILPTKKEAPVVPAPDVKRETKGDQQLTVAPKVEAPRKIEIAKCDNPNALGTSRIVEIDTASGPGFGGPIYAGNSFLQDKEVILTFDDGPWEHNTDRVLNALKEHCVKGLFFSVGKHATYYPQLVKRVAAEGHTLGTHTWSHIDLAKMTKQGGPQAAIDDFEKGVSAVAISSASDPAPFFRFPALSVPDHMAKYMTERHVAYWSADIDSLDFKYHDYKRNNAWIMSQLAKQGKGIILLHDFQKHTADGLPDLLAQLKAGGYKTVQVVAKPNGFKSKPEYETKLRNEVKSLSVSNIPVDSIVKTISQ